MRTILRNVQRLVVIFFVPVSIVIARGHSVLMLSFRVEPVTEGIDTANAKCKYMHVEEFRCRGLYTATDMCLTRLYGLKGPNVMSMRPIHTNMSSPTPAIARPTVEGY